MCQKESWGAILIDTGVHQFTGKGI